MTGLWCHEIHSDNSCNTQVDEDISVFIMSSTIPVIVLYWRGFFLVKKRGSVKQWLHLIEY